MENLRFIDATIEDLPRITEIYNSTIPMRIVTADTEPVSIESRKPWFLSHNPTKHPLWIVQDSKENAIGWISFQSFYGRPAYNATAEISIYLAEKYRGKGFGTQILNHAITTAPLLGITTLLGLIFAHNTPSLTLFHRCGFQEWGHLPNIATIDHHQYSLKILGLHV